MNIEKYKNDGWGLSLLGFQKLIEILNNLNDNIKIIEFGSGKSTEFFDDYISKSKKNIKIISYDNDINYAYKSINNKNVDVRLRKLVECSDESIDNMFFNKKIDKLNFFIKKSELSTKQKNNFYDIKDGEINDIYDLVVLDGPNGNGRNIAFLHLINHLKAGSYVFIDDYTHYDFVERFNQLFDYEIYFENKKGIKKQWELGGDFIILKIKKNENI